jgi:ABC-type multidrug transport system fused ATPase/permease subunit
MSKGKIVESGDHDKLINEYPDGIYAKFVKE